MRRAISTLSAIAVVAVLPMVATPAQAAPETLPAAPQADPGAKKLDNRSHPLSARRTALRQQAVEELLDGDAELKGRGRNRTIEMANGVEVEYGVTQHANLLTFLVEFGEDDPADLANEDFPAEGPLHNEIPAPGPSDNSTYWKADFNRQHFEDMFFNGMPEQGGESFKDLYSEMSSGRFDLEGDVSDWVQVPHSEAFYSDEDGYENQPEMTAFIGDSATAWYDAQVVAGKTDDEIRDYLAQYDQWDRYDIDGDGDYDEPDGYIDHFQAVHAGEGEEAGADIWTIWSHRWAANTDGFGEDGPECPAGMDVEAPESDCLVGGVQIGDTGYWIFDYTTEPENGGLGVFAHEFGHDLGLRDYYDTGSGDNSNGFWTLMDSGSWLGHGDGATGNSAGHMGATEKLFLGWYGRETADGFADLAVVDGAGASEEVVLGPSYHATSTGKQAVLVTLPEGHDIATGPVSTGNYLYSGTKDDTSVTATSPPISLPGGSPLLTANVAYSIENGADFAYLQVRPDGGDWSNVMTSSSVAGGGITGNQLSFADITADLSAYAGQEVQLRWAYVTDANTHGAGFLVRNVSVGTYSTAFGATNDWVLDGFHSVVDGQYEYDFAHSYVAENRTFDGYDVALSQGPYSHDYAVSAPGKKVDHYSYEDGLLVYYSNGAYGDNNTSEHPGYGANLPVDANPASITWSGTGADAAANGRLQAFDATFDVDETNALSLTREVVGGGSQSVDVPARPSVPVFDDSNVDGYWTEDANGWFSTKVAGAGTMIQVVSSDKSADKMVLKVGKRFVAALGGASLSGTAQPGSTLTATAPAWFQQGVTTTATWLRDGTPIPGAGGSTYQVQGADVGHTLSARVTGTKEGYASTTVTTSGVPATQAGAPTAAAAPRITGTARVGRTLKVTGAQWSVPGTSTYTWTVGGKTVGSGASYQPKPADAGKQVTATETFTAAGYAIATASATSGKVAKAKVSLNVGHSKAKRGKKVSVTVRATSPDLKVPGKVKLTYAGEKLKAAKLKKGKVTVKLPAHKAGKYKLKVTYPGATGFGQVRKTVKIKVK
ncbi:immune inhibitor A domain-containing protein [Nocardioides sp. LMS-CY]|uniref:immune inhibitor A domain-containing protein n=1 Tax=Nocardioides sp. (strain LMS-CY) TaxID=2840457 RepID=UPI0020796071|nr:immune inhibitor A domain-containing protein [Nocardioides sp. LMS-CY]